MSVLPGGLVSFNGSSVGPEESKLIATAYCVTFNTVMATSLFLASRSSESDSENDGLLVGGIIATTLAACGLTLIVYQLAKSCFNASAKKNENVPLVGKEYV